jgi:hypothetical protein
MQSGSPLDRIPERSGSYGCGQLRKLWAHLPRRLLKDQLSQTGRVNDEALAGSVNTVDRFTIPAASRSDR